MTDRVWVSVMTYAEIHHVDRHTVYKWLDAGLLHYYQIGRLIRIKNEPPANEENQLRTTRQGPHV